MSNVNSKNYTYVPKTVEEKMALWEVMSDAMKNYCQENGPVTLRDFLETVMNGQFYEMLYAVEGKEGDKLIDEFMDVLDPMVKDAIDYMIVPFNQYLSDKPMTEDKFLLILSFIAMSMYNFMSDASQNKEIENKLN